jgi:hypothetical protein
MGEQHAQRVLAQTAAPASPGSSLPVSAPGDAHEREAGRVADAVVAGRPAAVRPERSGAALARCPCGGTCPACGAARGEGGPRLRREANATQPRREYAPPVVHEVLASPGRPLDAATRGAMEERLGAGFGDVRVHTGPRAEESAASVGAHAYTVGHDMVFAGGRYAPGTRDGDRLIAHELVHVIQQGGTSTHEPPSSAGAVSGTSAGEVQREEDEEEDGECEREQILCFRRCWRRRPPWPVERGSRGHYLYCQSKCLAEYLLCVGETAAEMAFASMSAAMQWLREHPGVVVGTIVVVGGVVFIVATGGSGALVLVPALL